jgi:hypothetical protein
LHNTAQWGVIYATHSQSPATKGKPMKQRILQVMAVLLTCASVRAQVNSGSNGSDGAFNPTTNIVINMAGHPDGIYQYAAVNILAGVVVSSIPNANNSSVVRPFPIFSDRSSKSLAQP